MEPKKEHSEHEENGTTVERTSFYDPDTGTHGVNLSTLPTLWENVNKEGEP